ncbi:hypothetical protein [Nostoc sp.]|uniref:hypothetical protein n=1 Tax=Nostoc sp. TaxID=1180 RepID=UPI002FF615E7
MALPLNIKTGWLHSSFLTICQGNVLLALDDKSLQQNSANTIRTTRSIFVKNFFGLLIVSSGLLLGSFVPMQESAIAQQVCPNVSGNWKRPDGIILNFSQNGCTLGGTITNAPIHRISGVFFDNRTADVVVTRTTLSNGCTTLMYTTLTVLSVPNLIRINTYATDGKCDLSQNFTEDYVYTRL